MDKITASYNNQMDVSYIIDKKYRLSWNYGKSACTFDTITDLIDFIKNDLPKIETYTSNKNA